MPYTVTQVLQAALMLTLKAAATIAKAPAAASRKAPHIRTTTTHTTCRMVQETLRQEGALHRLPQHRRGLLQEGALHVCRHGDLHHDKKVPYQVCTMVQETCVKKVPYQVCTMEKYNICKQVPYTVCTLVPYTVHRKVPYTVTECVPCTICKQVQECVPYTVCVKRCRVSRWSSRKPACRRAARQVARARPIASRIAAIGCVACARGLAPAATRAAAIRALSRASLVVCAARWVASRIAANRGCCDAGHGPVGPIGHPHSQPMPPPDGN